ncbi:cytochrome c [Sulfitobacter sp. F26204]|uniref:c-type cytochrome n=1 Tax=Sulfitobacter sp. F26204 TaxID=2996014 RepID=UPI00225E1D21|nr:cytochrome c [Sulfitobacter sp. F26204]MCX7560900.1 cytochrome c [Sulfitobacter sp. F26204]
MVPAAVADHDWAQRDILAGQSLYGDHCASCHGANLEGQPNWRSPDADGRLPAPPHDGTGHTWHHDNALLFEYTKQGGKTALEARGVTGFNSGMPAFGETLSDAEIWNILAYIRSNWSASEQNAQDQRNPPH